MEKPVGPSNVKVKGDVPWSVLLLFCILLILFLIGASTCKVTSFSIYKNKADCMMKIIKAKDKKGELVDSEIIGRIERYCESYR